MLIQTPAHDPATLGGLAVLLAAVVLAATVVPSRRAARVDPAIALRYE
jgi:ABC-type antimicrobial peptide transport system permease subunit